MGNTCILGNVCTYSGHPRVLIVQTSQKWKQNLIFHFPDEQSNRMACSGLCGKPLAEGRTSSPRSPFSIQSRTPSLQPIISYLLFYGSTMTQKIPIKEKRQLQKGRRKKGLQKKKQRHSSKTKVLASQAKVTSPGSSEDKKCGCKKERINA